MINTLSAVPFVDLAAQHAEVSGEINAVIDDAIANSSFIGGPLLTNFERNFAAYCGTQQAAGVSDGTHALLLALHAIGVMPGDLVLTVAHTFIATAEAVIQCGAVPIFLDIDERTYTLSPAALQRWLEQHCRMDAEGVCRETKSGHRVAAVLPVHLYGLPADMEPILEAAAAFSLPVVEDACQAHGAWYTFSDSCRRRAGSMGTAGCFSFYPGKNLGAMGEAGAVVTDRTEIADRVRMLRDHGQSEKYVHRTRFGINGRLDAIQAGILDVKLTRLEAWNARRREVAAMYDAGLIGTEGIATPYAPAYGHHVYHLYVILVDNRNEVQQRLRELGIATGLHYPIPVHLQEAFADRGYGRGDLPVTERVADTVLSLPMYPHITDNQVEYVIDAVRRSV